MLDFLGNAFVYCAMAIFPICMVISFVIALLKPRIGRFIDARPALKQRYERIVEMGPKEGWSGYVLCAVVFIFLFGGVGICYLSTLS